MKTVKQYMDDMSSELQENMKKGGSPAAARSIYEKMLLQAMRDTEREAFNRAGKTLIEAQESGKDPYKAIINLQPEAK